MKKIFVLTGEPSGDKLASKVISKVQQSKNNIEYLCVGGAHLNSLGISSIFDLKEITYMAFTDVFLNIFKIRNKINKTVDEIIKFNPDILFSVDSPDFSLRVSKIVKNKNPNIEKKYFDKENISNTFVGHPLLDAEIESNVKLDNLTENKQNIISLFAGSRESEIKILAPILFEFIKKMNDKKKDFNFIFHSTDKFKNYLFNLLEESNVSNAEIISDEKIKNEILKKSIFAVVKSGTVSLEVCKLNIPSIIIYKMNYINYFLAKSFLKIKFVNMINIINDKEIIPELIQKDCNADEIFKSVYYLLNKPDLIINQLKIVKSSIEELKSPSSSSKEASKVLISYLA